MVLSYCSAGGQSHEDGPRMIKGPGNANPPHWGFGCKRLFHWHANCEWTCAWGPGNQRSGPWAAPGLQCAMKKTADIPEAMPLRIRFFGNLIFADSHHMLSDQLLQQGCQCCFQRLRRAVLSVLHQLLSGRSSCFSWL